MVGNDESWCHSTRHYPFDHNAAGSQTETAGQRQRSRWRHGHGAAGRISGRKNGTAISGATSSSYTHSDDELDNGTHFTVTVSKLDGQCDQHRSHAHGQRRCGAPSIKRSRPADGNGGDKSARSRWRQRARRR